NILNCLWETANGPATRWKRKAAILGGGALTASIAVVVGWSLFAPTPSAPPALVRPAPPAAAEQVSATGPPSSRAFTTEARTAFPLDVAIPVVAPPVVARPEPLPPLPAP